VSEAARRLAGLAAGLCQDAGISLQVHAGPWAWDGQRGVLSVDQRDLDALGPEACAGLLAVEVGRFFVTRHDLFEVDFPLEAAARTLLDALDTARAARWMRSRYPGIGVWLEAAVAQPVNPEAPAFLQLCQALVGGSGAHPDAEAVLALTRDARRRHAREVPPETLPMVWEAELVAEWRSEVGLRLFDPRWPPAPAEQALQLSAARAQEIADLEILPMAAALLERDLQRVSAWLRAEAGACQRARKALAEGETRALVAEAVCAGLVDGPAPAWVEELTARLYERALAGSLRRAVVRGVRYRPGAGRRGTLPELPPLELRSVPPTDYAAAQARVADQIEQLVRHLGEILRPRKRLRARTGYPSGRRVDLHRLMQSEADPRRQDKLWMRSTIPDRREVSVLLLVDLSGSMSGEKARCAVLGAILLAETLERLQTPFAVYGFQDVLIPFCDFGEGLNDTTRAALSQMSQEVEGSRPGGNNHPSYNDDGPCVREAADLLLERSSVDRVLIVVSDGEPAGRRSSAEDLHRVVAELGQADAGVDLVALGLGPDTGHVRNYYRDAEADVPVELFAERVGAVVERVLVG
jgi:hypothetical protein